MESVSKAIECIGGCIVAIGMCGLNSEGNGFWYAFLICVMGFFIALCGWVFDRLTDRKPDITEFHQRDKLDSDIEYFTYDCQGREVWTKK